MNRITRPTISALKNIGSRNYAKATLLGRLGAVPEKLETVNGNVYYTYPLAVTKPPKKDANGELVRDENGYPVRETNWFTVYNFNKNSAEYLPNLAVGSQLLVEAVLDQKTVPNDEGVNIKSIVVREISHRVVSKPKKE